MPISSSILALAGLAFSACGSNDAPGSIIAETAPPAPETRTMTEPQNPEDGLFAVIKTSKGTIRIKLEHERTPWTVANFVGLAEGKVKNTAEPEGTPYFDGIIFHRVIPGFMIQGGDPTGTGSGGPGYAFADEIHPDLIHDRAGTLSMANAGPATNGSQFFLTNGPTPHLNGRHAVFGYVVAGQDVVDAIASSPRDQRDRPNQEIRMEKVTIERVGKSAKDFDATKVLEQHKDKFRAR